MDFPELKTAQDSLSTMVHSELKKALQQVTNLILF